MGNCKTCKNAIFDETWGEYKCKARETVIYILLDSNECSDYKKGTPEVSKEVPDDLS
jgi:hypothetical protein